MDGLVGNLKHWIVVAFSLCIMGCQTPASVSNSGDLGGLEDIDSSPMPDESLDSSADLFSDMEPVSNSEPPPPDEEPASPPEIAQSKVAPEESISDQGIPPSDIPADSPPLTDNQQLKPSVSQILGLDYKAYENGGTVVITGNQPLKYSVRKNRELNQFVVEVKDSILPIRLQRPFFAKDIPGIVGAIQAYQSSSSDLSNIVIQLRAGFPEPLVQADGNKLLVVMQSEESPSVYSPRLASGSSGSDAQGALLSTASLEDYLRANSKFYGKKISIEFDDIELRDVFKLITEEAGINMIVAEDVKGKMSLKLRDVPWDQALVLILKSKRLGYTRSGNVLRIANLNEIRQEEEEAVKAALAIKDTAPLKVRLIPISYAPVTEIEKQVKPFLSKRGSVAVDARTSAVIVSDIEENLSRIEKVVASVDIPPTQVLIEGKIVEASDQFERRFGINWTASGKQIAVGSQSLNIPFQVSPAAAATGGTAGSASFFNFNPSFGTVDVLGELSAALSLYEREGQVKVLSSPRIVTLHNEAASIAQSLAVPVTSSTPGPGGVPITQVTYREAKLSLNVTPNVTNDGGVIMTVDVSREIPTEADPSSGQRSFTNRSAKTKVLIRNAQTAVIGGVYQNDITEVENRVPGLGNLPLVGWLFKARGRENRRSELMIFLTPRIIAQSTPASDIKKEEL